MEQKALTIRDNYAIDFNSPEIIQTLKNTVAQGATDAEFAMFLQFCKATGLNPFKKEIWFIKGKGYTNNRGEWIEGKVQMMTGINGFHSIANAHPLYDGIEVGFIDPQGEFKTQAYPKNDYIGAWCRVYRKDRRVPVEAVAMLSEYDKSKPEKESVWKTMKRVMITKCAESVGLRKAFSQELNGLYTAEEMPLEYSVEQEPAKAKTPIVIPADDLPKKTGEKFYYSEMILPEARRIDAVNFFTEHGATYDADSKFYVSDVKLPGCDKFLVDAPMTDDVPAEWKEPAKKGKGKKTEALELTE